MEDQATGEVHMAVMVEGEGDIVVGEEGAVLEIMAGQPCMWEIWLHL